MDRFVQNRPWIDNEFETAKFDSKTGLSAEALSKELKRMGMREDAPRPIVCAEAYAWLLDNVQLAINEHTPFSVKLNLGIDYSYFASLDIFQLAMFTPWRAKVLAETFPDEYDHMIACRDAGMGEVYTDFWHTVPNWPYLLENGFAGILRKAESCKADLLEGGDYTDGQIVFLDSVIIRYRAILRLLERIYTYSLSFAVPAFSACIRRLIDAPPQSLYDVMQFAILYLYVEEIGCERGRTLGAIDQMYWPYMRRDRENGCSEDDICELFRYFFIHFTATKRYAEQPFVLGGSDADGRDRSNELTALILDVYDEMNIYDPKIHLRYHAAMDSRIFIKALSMIRGGHSSICLINDEAVYRGYEKIGIPREQAADYVLLGCYEPIIIGKEEAEIATTWLNGVKSVELALFGGRDLKTGRQLGAKTPTDIDSFDSLLDIYLQQLDHCMDFAIDFAQKQGLHSTEINPSPLYSSSFPVCLETGRDVHEYPLPYNNMSLKIFGLATVVDSLMAVKRYVFERQDIALDDLRRVLISDWEGYEPLRQKIVNDRDKYGNNRPESDAVMKTITDHLATKYAGRRLPRGGVLRLGLDSIYNCVEYGMKLPATPDGRKAGTPVSKNLCAVDGMDRDGITAYMQSVLKIDASSYLDAAPLDFVMHPSAVEGDKGLEDFASLIRIFFANGGFAAQGNIINGDTLRDAQEHPERYATLQVRVCGWNEYFVKLSRVKQDMFIKQCEVNAP